jgi:hypothetical protein
MVNTITPEVRKAIGMYFSNGTSSNNSTTEWIDSTGKICKNTYHNITKFALEDSNGQTLGETITHNTSIRLVVEGCIFEEESALNIGYILYNEHNYPIFWSWARQDDIATPRLLLNKNGNFRLESIIPPNYINEGNYRIELVSGITQVKWLLAPNTFEIALSFQMVGGFKDVIINPSFNWQLSIP